MSGGPDQAPPLPPKPGNGYSPFMRPLPQHPHAAAAGQQQQRSTGREQVRVIYAYTPSNSDELAMQVGDIIDVIDKNIEDQGWWKGELNGKVGVFPDNFVQLIAGGGSESAAPTQDWQNSSRLSGSASNHSHNTSASLGSSGAVTQQHQQQPMPVIGGGAEGRVKSVFAGTPKGFSKELESNLEKHNSQASFLSLKRNKLHQMATGADTPPVPLDNAASASLGAATSVSSLTNACDLSERHNGHSTTSLLETSPGKLNHMTANRAKGPTRRPPKNILNKRNTLLNNDHKSDPLNEPKDERQQQHQPPPPVTNQANLLAGEPKTAHTDVKPQNQSRPFTGPVASESVSSLNGKPHQISPGNQSGTSDGSPVALGPKTNPLTLGQGPVIGAQDVVARAKLASSSSSSSTTTTTTTGNAATGNATTATAAVAAASTPWTPPWMVELRKTNAEKKRDPPPTSVSTSVTTTNTTSSISEPPVDVAPLATPVTPVTQAPAVVPAPSVTPMTSLALASNSTATASVTTTPTATQTVTTNTTTNSPSIAPPGSTNESSVAKLDSIVKQISRDLHAEIRELRGEVRQLRDELKSVNELRDTLDAMKVELKTCQSATESQRRYIKDLVNNLADERKRIAAMQVEIDRNLK